MVQIRDEVKAEASRVARRARNRGGNGASRGVGLTGGTKPIGSPTTHLPGSEGKIRVLMERARRGQPLWHDDDARGLPRDDAVDEDDDDDDTEEEGDEDAQD